MLLVDVDTMAELHVRWMDEPGPTDVMSLPDGRARARRPARRAGARARRCSATSCCAPSSPPSRRPRPATASRTNCICCTVHGVPAPARLRPRRARGGAGDVRRCRTTAGHLVRRARARSRAGRGLAARDRRLLDKAGFVDRSSDARVSSDGADRAWRSPARARRRPVRRHRLRTQHRSRRPGSRTWPATSVRVRCGCCTHHRRPAAVHQPAAAAADRRRRSPRRLWSPRSLLELLWLPAWALCSRPW